MTSVEDLKNKLRAGGVKVPPNIRHPEGLASHLKARKTQYMARLIFLLTEREEIEQKIVLIEKCLKELETMIEKD